MIASIRSFGSYCSPASEDVADLKAELRRVVGKNIRRIDRFTQLALIGAHRCAGNIDLPERTNVYLGSGLGPYSTAARALTTIFKAQEPLMPLDFINLVGNFSSFNVAKTLGIEGANLFVTNMSCCLGAIVELALIDLQSSMCECALVGWVDECVVPLSLHRNLARVDSEREIAEGSHWLLLDSRPLAQTHGTIVTTCWPSSIDELIEIAIQAMSAEAGDCLAALGANLTEYERSRLAAHFDAWEYQATMGFHCGMAGNAVFEFLTGAQPDCHAMLHVEKAENNVLSAVLIERP